MEAIGCYVIKTKKKYLFSMFSGFIYIMTFETPYIEDKWICMGPPLCVSTTSMYILINTVDKSSANSNLPVMYFHQY